MATYPVRELLTVHVRAFPGWERVRAEVAGALGLPIAEVRGLRDDADPAVRLEALAFVEGFRLQLELYIDAARAPVPTVEALAVALARRFVLDVAHHDGSNDPYAYVLVRSDGRRFAASEIGEETEGLTLGESADALRALPPL